MLDYEEGNGQGVLKVDRRKLCGGGLEEREVAAFEHRGTPTRSGDVLRGCFRRSDPADARILVLDGAPRILPTFDERLSARAADHLRRFGVEIEVGAMVVGVEEAHGRPLPYSSDWPQLRRAGS
jgi:Pyridine nucleotide-disulphide oxidoreductase